MKLLTTKEEIILASLRLFAKKGFEATSIRDIALEAGVNSSTLYYYIKTKEDFLMSIMNDELENLIKSAEDIISILETPEQRIASLAQMHVMAHGTNQLAMLVTDTEYRALHGENRTRIGSLRKKYEQLWTEIVSEGAKTGVFTQVKNPKFTTFAVLAMCTGIVHWYSPKGKDSLLTISKEFANMSLTMLGAEKNGKSLSIDDLRLLSPTKYYNNM